MSFFKQMFQCCKASNTKSEVVLDTSANNLNETSSQINYQSTIITKSDKTKRKSTISIVSSPEKCKVRLFSVNNQRYSLCLSNNQSVVNNPDYIPINEIEVTPNSLEHAKKIQISDVIGNLFYGAKIEITCRGIMKRKRQSICIDNIEVEMIKTINYFWIKQQSNTLTSNTNLQKDYILNYSCDYLSNLATNYLFLICFIKEYNYYKIKFNDSFKNTVLSENIQIQISHLHPSLLPRNSILKSKNTKINLNILPNSILEVAIEGKGNKKYIFHPEAKKCVTIGKGKKCDVIIINDDSLSDINTTLIFDISTGLWNIKDGNDESASMNGTWIFSNCPIIVYNGMNIRFWNYQFVLNLK